MLSLPNSELSTHHEVTIAEKVGKSEQLKILGIELKQKSDQLKDLNKTKAEVERLKREKEEIKDRITLEKEKELTKLLGEEKFKIKKQVEDENFLR